MKQAYKISQSGTYQWICFAENIAELKEKVNSFFVPQVAEFVTDKIGSYFLMSNGIKLNIIPLFINFESLTII